MNSLRLLPLLAFAAAAHAADMFPFQLPWDDASESATNVSWLNDKPAGAAGFVHVKDGHLFAGEKRLRIFGVNTCFGANFPDKDMAPKVAARMAKFGINCVRFHHMDMMNAPAGIFAKDGRTLDAGQLDRLDFFIAELKKNGIYADLNLHVSRTHPDRPREEKKGNPDYDKGVDNYCAAMIALQKDYARDLLTHVNAYTGNRYADEPAVALVEINNENAFGRQWFGGEMDDLPKPYRVELENLWAAWILKKRGSDDAARKAWSEGAREAGAEMLTKPAWNFEQHSSAAQTHSEKDGAITVNVTKPGTETWHVQFSTSPLAVKAGSYEVRFRVRAPKDASLSVALMQSHEPWKVLGSANVKPGKAGADAGDGWREVSATIQTGDADDKARLTIGGMGATTGAFEFSGISLRTAGVDGSLVRSDTRESGRVAAPPEGLRGMRSPAGKPPTPPALGGRVPIILKRDLARYTSAKQRDWQEFIWDTETAYWNGMRDFLKKELGVKAPVVGTQGFWSPGHVQAGMDVIDSHAYWHHPDFHGRGWNPDVWDVKNEPMAGAPDGGTLPGLAAQRVAGKPFICTEYNHPAPNTYSAETFPLLCAFAAHQEWDGVFAFSYSHRAGDGWAQESFNNFFDIDRHSVKMATLPAAVISFRRGDLYHSRQSLIQVITREAAIRETLVSGPNFARKFPFFSGASVFESRVAVSPARLADRPSYEKGDTWEIVGASKAKGDLLWITNPPHLILIGSRSWFIVGAFNSADSSPVRISGRGFQVEGKLTSRVARHNWACYQFTALDSDEHANLSTARRILITATGDIENTGMGWKNAAKTSVGRDWGKAPVLVEGPAAKIELPGTGKFKAWALDERGQRRAEIPVADSTLEIGPQWKTLWYEVERE